MMKKSKKIMASVLTVALVVSSLVVANGTDAAKKAKLNAKKKEITVDQSFTLKVKNKAKKAKVTWKVSDKKVLAITAKKVKAKKATATIKGLSEGTAKVTAVYKLGKKKTKLVCKVTVGAAVETPVATLAPSKAPSAAPTKTPAPTKKPVATATPKPTRTPRPTATPTPKLTNEHKVNLGSVQISGENGGSARYANNAIESTMGNLNGFIVESGITSNANKYTHVKITYTLDGGDVNLYIADGSRQGTGSGETASGWSPEIKLQQGTHTLTLSSKQYFPSGDGSARAVKLFNFGSSTTMKITAISYYMSE